MKTWGMAMKLRFLRYISAVILSFCLSSPANVASQINADEAYEIGLEAYIYLYPLVTMDVTRRNEINMTGQMKRVRSHGHVPSLSNLSDGRRSRRGAAQFRHALFRGWLDLTEEPMIVSVPDTAGRYYLLPMLDMWTDVFAVPGQTDQRHRGPDTMRLVPPGWQGLCRTGSSTSTRPRPTSGSSAEPRPTVRRTTQPCTRSRTAMS